MTRTLLLGIALLAAHAVFPDQAKTAALVVSPAALRLRELLVATTFNPQWDSAKPALAELPWANALTDYSGHAAAIYLLGQDQDPKVKPLFAKENNLGPTRAFVENGGTVIILGDRCLPSPDLTATGPWAELLGAEKITVLDGPYAILRPDDPLLDGIGGDADLFRHTLHGPGLGLAGLTTAAALIGAADGAAMTVNRLGKGRVVFLNVRLSESFTSFPQPYHPTANAAWRQYRPFARMLQKIVLDAGATVLDEAREVWDPVPLGPASNARVKTATRPLAPLESNRMLTPLAGNPTILVSQGQPAALIVTATSAAVQLNAAKRLAEVIAMISGANLAMATEDTVAVTRTDDQTLVAHAGQSWPAVIALGDTAMAASAGLAAAELPPDGIAISSQNGVIAINAANLSWAVEAFLHDFLGYRKLWPGGLGDVYPRSATLTIPATRLTDRPALLERAVRNGYSSRANPWKAPDGTTVTIPRSTRFLDACDRLGLDPRETTAPLAPHASWWPAQRLGGRLPAAGGGTFYSWRNKYADRPEFFALQADGTRATHEDDVRICKSNPAVLAATVQEVLAAKTANPGLGYFMLSPCDGGSKDIFCLCPSCRAWDPRTDQVRTWRLFLGRNRPVFQYPGLTDRVLRFTCDVARAVRPLAPDLKIMYLAYAGYQAPPLYYNDIPDNVVANFVGLQYFNDEALAAERAIWDFWAGISREMRWRPNLLLDGHGMPAVYVKKLARDLRHCRQTGMIAADFDSLIHHWATQGLNYYVLARLLWDPAQDAEDVVQDYCQRGFGPAASAVRHYFELCEQVTDRLAAGKASEIAELEDLSNTQLSLLDKLPYYYTPDVLAAMTAALDQAEQAVATPSPEHDRVAFLRLGLDVAIREVDFLQRHRAAAGHRLELKEYVLAHTAFLRETFQKQPFAVNVFDIARDTWPRWRDCGLYAR